MRTYIQGLSTHLKHFFNRKAVVPKETVESLFLYTRHTLPALLVVEIILLYLLQPLLGSLLYVWFGLVFALTLSRLYDASLFQREPQRHTFGIWYRIFILKAWLVAFLFSLMVLIAIPQLDLYYQLFVFIILLGVTGGAVNALSSDLPSAIGYLIILLLPLSLMMILSMEIKSFILGLLLIIYFLTLVSVILQSARQQKILEKTNRRMTRVESKLYEKEEMLELFFDQAPIGIFTYSPEYIITDVNRAFLQLFDLKKHELLGTNLYELPDQSPLEAMKNALMHKTSQIYVGSYTSMKGYIFWVEAKISPIFDRHQYVVGGIVLLENKTKEHNALKELEYSAQHDLLTSLSNRRGFKKFMEHMIVDEQHATHYSVLFYLDLNHFKQINDSLGHSMGDKLLIAISKRLKHMMKEAKNIARPGGDEFIIVIPFVSRERYQAEKITKQYIQHIQKIFDDPFVMEGVRLHMKSSIGIVIVEPGFNNIEEIVRHADISMYQAKEDGHDFISYYNTALDEERKKVFTLQNQLVTALSDNELAIFFQPIVHISDDSIYAAEALIRWEHPQHGLMGAETFIPIAVESGMVIDIGWWVIEQICRQIVQWKEEGVWHLKYIAVNINAKQLLKNNFAKDFIGILEKYNIKSSDIKIEITETSLIENFKLTQEVILSLQEYGIGCAIDDFGTGYSSLSYLKKLSFSDLKIDREFMHELEENSENIKLIHTIINIGKQFNYNVIVEGIEEIYQKNMIKAIDATLYYQGYLISPPIPEKAFKRKFLRASML